MQYHLKYHNGFRAIRIPEKANTMVLQPSAMPARYSLSEMLAHTLDSASLQKQLHSKNPASIAIAIPDESQPVPVEKMLPAVLQNVFLQLNGLDPTAVTIIIANGPHPELGRETIRRLLLNDVVRRCNLIIHDAHDAPMTDVGVTRRGTPVRVNTAFAEADFKIVLGLIEPHQFFGFTGGVKEAAVGCASAESIRHNHSLIKETHTRVGHLGSNPMRDDLDEAGRMIGIDFAVGIVLNTDRQVARVVAGQPEDVLRYGSEICAAAYGVEIANKYDIALASCAGDHGETSACQILKGLYLVSHAVRDGGKILLLAASRKGFGDDVYFDYVCPFVEPRVIEKEFLALGYEIGDRRADRFGGTFVEATADDFAGSDTCILRHCHLRAADPSTIMEEWVETFEGVPEVAVIPQAMTTYFISSDDQSGAGP